MAFPTALAVKLSGATEHQLAYWRRQGILVPETEHEKSPFLYSFRDVIALRTIAWLRADHSLQQIRQSLDTLRELDMVKHPAAYKLVKLGSSIGVKRDGRTVDVANEPGQEVLGSLEEVFGAFETRQKRRVGPLEAPHPGIEVDPRRLGGWPTIEGTRVPYDAIARLLANGVTPEQVSYYYPSVSAEAARDALDFDREVHGPAALTA